MLSPQLLPAQQAFVQCHRLQLIHDAGACLHHTVAMPQQLPQIAILPARHPDLGKVILQQQTQNMQRILPIGLLFAPAFTPYLRRISHPQLELQLRQQSFEPACVSAGFHTHTHLLTGSRQAPVELLRFLSVSQSLLSQFSAFCIDKSNLLDARMVITPYNKHVGSFLRAGWLALHHQPYSDLGADIVMESITQACAFYSPCFLVNTIYLFSTVWGNSVTCEGFF